MLETYTALLTEITRNLFRNARESKVLYLWFVLMIVFSLGMLAVLTMFMIGNEVTVSIGDMVLALCFMFLFKSSADMHRYFSTSLAPSYPLATQVSQRRTVFEIFFVVFWVNLGLFVLFSSLYMIFLGLAGVYLGYPVEYLQIIIGIVLGIVLGACFALHFFSAHRIRLIPFALIAAGLWFFRDIWALSLFLILAVVYLRWSLNYTLDSFHFVARKKHKKEHLQVGISRVRTAIFYKETITLWRDKLLSSYVFTAALMGGFSGYLAVFGEDLFIPENLQVISQSFLPSAYAVLGIYILVIYTSVFTTVALFLNEENTVWILRHLPVKEKTIIQGKVLALLMPFVASLPFLAYYAAFTGTEQLLFCGWFLVFSFLAGIIVSLPFGVRYLGRKSDILVLYCVALIVFVFVAIGAGLENVFTNYFHAQWLFYVVSILVELVLLWVSIALSSYLFSLKYEGQKISKPGSSPLMPRSHAQ